MDLDDLGSCYDSELRKNDRPEILCTSDNVLFYGADLEEESVVDQVFIAHKPKYVLTFATQVGVQYSLKLRIPEFVLTQIS